LNAKVSESSFIFNETPSGTIDGTNVTFNLASSPLTGKLQVMLNGLVLRPGAGADYTVAGAVITFESGAQPQSGDVLRATYVVD
jgi:curli biogenesis system outer membrane secretion channel CsgG